jgi:hypothetical protein
VAGGAPTKTANIAACPWVESVWLESFSFSSRRLLFALRLSAPVRPSAACSDAMSAPAAAFWQACLKETEGVVSPNAPESPAIAANPLFPFAGVALASIRDGITAGMTSFV